MVNNTALYHLLSGHRYYKLSENKKNIEEIKNVVDKEIEYFFNKRFTRNEKWYQRYLKILVAVFTVNLLAREFDRKLAQKGCMYNPNFSETAISTYFAIREFNKSRKHFFFKTESSMFISEIVRKVYENVKKYIMFHPFNIQDLKFIGSNTPLGIELEFSNVGKNAGYLFETGKNDPLLNFSKYHYYHLTKFMWRFGAYIDANTSFQQFIKKGGFLEYTFTVPDHVFKPSMPLTNSPDFASELIKEAVRFTPVKPHSLHVTLQTNNKKLPFITLEDMIYFLLVTGHFIKNNGQTIESRVTEGNMKDIAYLRQRKNSCGIVDTIEFTNMRLSRDFVRRGVYKPSIFLMIAYKNLFRFYDIVPFFREIIKWGKKPTFNNYKLTDFLNIVKLGLDKEISLPEQYKNLLLSEIKELFLRNTSFINDI